jgi:hypothetical protein
MRAPTTCLATVPLLPLWLRHPRFHFLEMCIQHQTSVNRELDFEVAASFPLAWADAAVARAIVEVEMRVVLLPGLVESVVEVFKKFLDG